MTGTKEESALIIKGIDSIYKSVVEGVIPGMDSAQELAESYLKDNESPLEAAKSLIRWQNTKAAVGGALTGLGGFVTMIATLPVNVTTLLYLQIRMIVAIAYIGGERDFKDDKVETAVMCCVLGESLQRVAKKMGVDVTTKLALKKLIPMISGKTISKINQAVGFRLVTKFGSKGVINLAKGVPVLGAAVGAAFDGYSTNAVGNAAIETFITKND